MFTDRCRSRCRRASVKSVKTWSEDDPAAGDYDMQHHDATAWPMSAPGFMHSCSQPDWRTSVWWYKTGDTHTPPAIAQPVAHARDQHKFNSRGRSSINRSAEWQEQG